MEERSKSAAGMFPLKMSTFVYSMKHLCGAGVRDTAVSLCKRSVGNVSTGANVKRVYTFSKKEFACCILCVPCFVCMLINV